MISYYKCTDEIYNIWIGCKLKHISRQDLLVFNKKELYRQFGDTIKTR